METSVSRVSTPEEQIFDNDTSTEEHGSSNLKNMLTISILEEELKKTIYSVQEYAEYNAWLERQVAEFKQNKLVYEQRVKDLETQLAQERQEKHQILAEFDEFQRTCCARDFSTPSPKSRSPFSSSLSSPTYPSSLQSMTSLWHSDSNSTPCSSSPSSSHDSHDSFSNDTRTEEHISSSLQQLYTIYYLEQKLKETKYSVQEYAELNDWLERKVGVLDQNDSIYKERLKDLETQLAQERQEKHQIQAEFDEFQKTCCARDISTPSPTSQSQFCNSLTSPTYPSSPQSMTWHSWHSNSTDFSSSSCSPFGSQNFPTMQLGLFQPFTDQEEENSNEQVCCRCNACYWSDFEPKNKSKFGAVGDGRQKRKTQEELAHFVSLCEKPFDPVKIESSMLNESAR